MDFKKKRLEKALEDKTYRVKLVHGKKGWLAVGLTFITLFSASMFGQKVEASAVNNVAVANSANSNYVQLWSDVTSSSIHKANRGLANGTAWKTAKAVKGYDGQTYILVGGNEYANANQMDLADETSKQDLSGIVLTNVESKLYTNPLAANGPQLITNRGLADNTAWKTDEKVVVNGQTYYRVATDEWIKATNVTLTSESSRGTKDYTKNSPMADTVVDTNNNSNSGSTTTPVDPDKDKEVNIIINYRKQSTHSADSYIMKSEVKKAKLGSNITIDAPEIPGYTVVPGENGQTYEVKYDGETFNIPYTMNKGTEMSNFVTYTLKFVNESGDQIQKPRTDQAAIGTTVNENADQIDGYELVGNANQALTISKDGDNTITFVYKSKKTETNKTANVTLTYSDENGNEIAKSKVLEDQKVGTYIAETPVAIDGYTLLSGHDYGTMVSPDGTSRINFVYRKNADTTAEPNDEKADVTIKTIDSTEKVLLPNTVTPDKNIGEDFTIAAPIIDGYTPDKTNKTVVVKKGGSEITFVYTKKAPEVKKANVTIKAVDENNQSLVADEVVKNQEVGKYYSTKAPVVEGYTPDEANKSVKVSEEGSTITFIYTKDAVAPKTATITTKFVDENDKEIAKSTTSEANIGDNYPAKAIDVDGYTVKGDATKNVTVDGDKTVTFTYVKNAKAEMAPYTIQMLSAENGYVVGRGIVTDGEIGETITVKAPELSGYDIVGATSKEITINSNGETTATFRYKRNETKMKALISQLNSELFKLTNEFRVKNNVPELKSDPDLQAGAEVRVGQLIHATDVLHTDIGHNQPDGTDFSEESHLANYVYEHGPVGENIGYGGAVDSDISKWAQHIFDSTIGDSVHAQNTLTPDYVAGGFAVGISPENNNVYAVTDFGMGD
ncbi:MucBP domain-containing protein [Companilactobacillus sp. HBUAS56257]|uniref:MucBP domain-containing protein n=1 Tax=Companilactobacillus sp. HBUAS56257 TaxID=3109360 RepID=UPI002FF075F1